MEFTNIKYPSHLKVQAIRNFQQEACKALIIAGLNFLKVNPPENINFNQFAMRETYMLEKRKHGIKMEKAMIESLGSKPEQHTLDTAMRHAFYAYHMGWDKYLADVESGGF